MFYKVKLVVSFTLLLLSPLSWADCVADINAAEAQEYFDKGRKLQDAGKDAAALNQYVLARGYVCDSGGNPVLRQAMERGAFLGKKNGAIAGQKQHWFDESINSYGAFQWYEKSGHFAKADHALVLELKRDPSNLQLSAAAQAHFRHRSQDYFSANNKDLISATEPYQMSQQHFDYVAAIPPENIKLLLQKQPELITKAYLDELTAFTLSQDNLRNTDLVGNVKLQQQAQSFAQKWQGKGLDVSAENFDLAVEWTRQMPDYNKAEQLKQQINQVRLKQADLFSRDYAESHEILQQALSFYLSADRADLVQKVQVQATAIGDKAMADKKYLRASKYYNIAQQDEKMELAEQKLAEERESLSNSLSQQMLGQSQQQIDAMKALANDPEKIKAMQQNALKLQKELQQKQKQQQKKFGEETDSLADELGIE